MTDQRRSGRWAFALASAALLWGLALIPAAFLVPVYGTDASGPAGSQSGSASLVAVNGTGVLIVVLLPALLAMIAWSGLRLTCSRSGRTGRAISTGAIAVLGLLTLLTGFSIGPELLPVLVLLIVAAGLTPDKA